MNEPKDASLDFISGGGERCELSVEFFGGALYTAWFRHAVERNLHRLSVI